MGAAHAQSALPQKAQGIFDRSLESDWALGWLEAIFRGAKLPAGLADGASHLTFITTALRQALSLYSVGMLVLAGFLLIYHVVAIIAETAHYGTAMGRRANQLWAPIRFVFAIALLVPIGGGLNSGQFLIVKLAEQGSSLASNAWSGAVNTMRGSFSDFIAPRSPDVARLTAVAVEMEMCRDIYRQVYTSLLPDSVLNRVGDIFDIRKNPSARLAPETWLYSNNLQAALPLCGAYRFPLQSSIAATDEMARSSSDLSGTAHAEADRLIVQSRMIADNISPAFLTATQTFTFDINSSLATLIQEQQQALDVKLRAMASGNTKAMDQSLDDSAKAGWIAAGIFLTDLTRKQAAYGDLAAHAIPEVEAPLFGHKVLSHALVTEVLADDPVLRLYTAQQNEKLFALYDQTGAAMKQVRGWLYGQQMPNADLMMPDQFDVRDRIGSTSDAETGFFLFTRLLNAATVTYGVWADAPQDTSGTSSSSLAQDMASNPFTAMAEMGRRYQALGSWLFGMVSPALTEPGVMTSALLFAAVGLGFSAAGFMLIFLLPLLPFFRFFLAVLTWFLAVFEAVVALPLVALAHMNPVGDGLSGAVARRAYWLWLGVFMRPVLTLFGFLIGLLLLTFAMTFLHAVFTHLTGSLALAHSDVLVAIRVAMAFLYAVLAYAVTNAAFKGITLLPDRTLRWLGSLSATESASAVPAMQAAGASQHQHSVASAASPALLERRISGGPGQAAAGAGARYGEHAAATAGPHSLKAALIPEYRDLPEKPVVIGDREGTVAGARAETGKSGVAGAAASAGIGSGSVKAEAHASALATIRQMPLPDKMTHPDIVKAVEKLALLVEGQETKAESDVTSSKEIKKPEDKSDASKTESREQSSAPPEGEKPE
jgi:conjugal transfer/type IV secretion protein DotA/TraY